MTSARATNLQELKPILGKLFTEEGVKRGMAFKPRPSDVIIAPFSKCGTTWMQQTVHGLRSRGSMDFGELTEVVPWIDAAHDLGQDLKAEQPASPRLFKSHLAFDQISKGARYICVLRDPCDALVSMYNFFSGWLMEPGSIDFEDFAANLYLARRPPAGYWHHLITWCEQQNNPNVLLLCYEHMKTDFDRHLERIAAFMSIELDDELRDIVTRQSSLAFMREHDSHFNDHFLRDIRQADMGLPEDGAISKVRPAGTGIKRRDISSNVEQLMAQRWQETVTPQLGWKSYQELLQDFSQT
jgi:hypothetical protein